MQQVSSKLSGGNGRKYELDVPRGCYEAGRLTLVQMKSAKYILQLPFRKVYVLPAAAVNEYAWKPDSAISESHILCSRSSHQR